jgi:hypothetical protein
MVPFPAFGKRRVDLAMADFMDGELLPALQRLGDQVVAVDVDRAQRPAAQRTRAVGRGRLRRFGDIGNAGTARHEPDIEAAAPV